MSSHEGKSEREQNGWRWYKNDESEKDDHEEEEGGNAETETSDLGLAQENFLRVASWFSLCIAMRKT